MGFGFLRGNRESVHEWTRDRMSAFLDAQLPADEAVRMEGHLRECRGCADELRALRMTRQLLRAMPATRLPRTFALAAAPSPVRPPGSFLFLRTATAVAATAFVALLAASAVLQGGTPAAAPAAPPAAAQSRQAPAAAAPAAGTAQPVPALGAAQPAPTPQQPPAGAPSQAAPAGATFAAPQIQAPQAQRSSESAQTATAQDTAASPASGQGKTASTPAPGALAAPQPDGGASPLFLLQVAAAALTALFALASGAIWWIARRRQ